MARKALYLYQITMGHGNKDEEVGYCYARNAGVAIDNFKIIFKEKKYDSFSAKMFGEAHPEKYDASFIPMSREEVEYISQQNLAQATVYAQRKDVLPENGVFIPAEEIQGEGTVI